MNKVVRCAECEYTPAECSKSGTNDEIKCLNCNKYGSCCCLSIHLMKEEKCCNDLCCKNMIELSRSRLSQNTNVSNTASFSLEELRRNNFGLRSFFLYAKGLYAAALGIEILCIAATEIGLGTIEYAGSYYADYVIFTES